MRTLSLLLLFTIALFHAIGQPGSLDPTFGKNGIQTTAFIDTANLIDERGRVVLTDANGDIFIVAQTDYIRIIKYLPDGRLDSSYRNANYSNLGMGFFVTSAAFQGDKIVVVGYYTNPSTDFNYFVLTRYTADGILDSSFGVNGIVTTGLADYGGYANTITMQGDKILVAGFTLVNFDKGILSLFALVRYTTNGTLDTSFGSNGIVTADLGGGVGATSISLQSDKILVAGSGILARFTANGVLDPSFGVNGTVVTNLGGPIVLQSSKIIVAGDDYALARYTADGKLDSSFGVNGKATIHLSGSENQANSVVLQVNKIVVGGYTYNDASSYDFRLVRYTANGRPDSSFGVNGIVTTDFSGSDDKAYSIALQENNIIAAGYAVTRNYDYALARYTPDGVPDTSFGVNGELAGHFPTSRLSFTSTAIQGSKVVAAGYALKAYNIYDFALARYNTDGTLDSSFGKNGIVTDSLGNPPYNYVTGIAVQGGKILIIGSALARFTADGRLDSSFGVNGIVTFVGNSIALQGNKIIVSGASYDSVKSSFSVMLARFMADGKTDSSFGVNGEIAVDFNYSYFSLTSIALQGDNILVAGTAGNAVKNTTDFALVRFTKDGVLDASFGVNGIVTTDFDNNYDNAYAIALQGDKIVVAGRSISGSFGGITYFALARYNANGTLDNSFGTNGKITAYLGGSDGANSIANQGSKIIVAGGGFEVFTIARYTTKGTLDSTFGVNGIAASGFGGNTTVQDIAVHENRLYAVGGLDSSYGSYGAVAAYQLEAPEPSITIADVTVCESQKQAWLTFHLSAPSTQPVRVLFKTHYITAYPSRDYISAKSYLKFAPGTTTASSRVRLVDDSICEPTEQFEVVLLSAQNATIHDSIGIVTVTDDDCTFTTLQQSSNHQEQAVPATDFGITAGPNPSADAFTIQLHSTDLKQPVSIRVYDVSGRLLEQRMNITIGQIVHLGDQYKSGTYILEAMQGSRRVQTKVIKTGK